MCWMKYACSVVKIHGVRPLETKLGIEEIDMGI